MPHEWQRATDRRGIGLRCQAPEEGTTAMASSFIQRGAEGYDRYMGRWSRRLTPLFIDFAGIGANECVLDVGCGTGNLVFELTRWSNLAGIEGIDYEEACFRHEH